MLSGPVPSAGKFLIYVSIQNSLSHLGHYDPFFNNLDFHIEGAGREINHLKNLLLWARKQEIRKALATCLNEKSTLEKIKSEIKPQ